MKLVHTLLLLVYYCIMCLISGTQQNEEIKDEVNVQPHAMKGTSCIILCVYIFMCIKGDVKEQILQCMFIVIIMFVLSMALLPLYTIFYYYFITYYLYLFVD